MEERPVTLADLKELNAPVRAHCDNCQKTAYVSTEGMPEHTIIIHIARRLRCSRCGSTKIVTRPCYQHMVPQHPGEQNR
ncbi:hypothetical protein PsAD37_03824 [Pseudovibrio sp. Ad37]|nr:hypothetical protein PsAD37_03824 [Pseudovibrio sp. Ad37]KZL23677.1 hypothetical protein PsWM33_02965 [Pseudovibrio sp. WM33]